MDEKKLQEKYASKNVKNLINLKIYINQIINHGHFEVSIVWKKFPYKLN